jgi:hypothetical protein
LWVFGQLKSEDRGKRERRFSLVFAKERVGGERSYLEKGSSQGRRRPGEEEKKKMRLVWVSRC